MKTLIYILQIVFMLFLFAYCSEAPNWSDSVTDDVPPGVVSDIDVVNIPGGAVITYTLPSDKDLLGVKAIFSYSESGQSLESFSSAFRDTIEINGFPDTSPRKVKLVCIDQGKNESLPVEVTIEPLTPPVEIIQRSLFIRETFGGVFVSWKNENRENIGISLYSVDSLGFMNLDYTYYTNSREETFSFRGYAPKSRKFRVQVRDRWGNFSTPKDTLLTPIFEEYVVRKDPAGIALWERYGYNDKTAEWRGDYRTVYSSCHFYKMFNLKTTGSSDYFNAYSNGTLDLYTGVPDHKSISVSPFPMHLTIDMKEEIKLSRFVLYYNKYTKDTSDPRKFSIWATNETPKGPKDFGNDRIASLIYWTPWEVINGTEAWKNDWVKLGDFEIIPPSGATEEWQWTSDDFAWAQAGVEFDFDPPWSFLPYRYIRIICYENVKKSGAFHFAEMEFYGSFVNQ